MRYEYSRKPRKCPACGSNRIAKIMYGFPAFTGELQKSRDAGRIVIGGCLIGDDDPVWQCVDCETSLFKKSSGK